MYFSCPQTLSEPQLSGRQVCKNEVLPTQVAAGDIALTRTDSRVDRNRISSSTKSQAYANPSSPSPLLGQKKARSNSSSLREILPLVWPRSIYISQSLFSWRSRRSTWESWVSGPGVRVKPILGKCGESLKVERLTLSDVHLDPSDTINLSFNFIYHTIKCLITVEITILDSMCKSLLYNTRE
jgi:hypothetical protein